MLDNFEVNLGADVRIAVRPFIVEDEKEYDLYIHDRYFCTIYRDPTTPHIEWKSYDRIHQKLVNMIGRLIDNHNK